MKKRNDWEITEKTKKDVTRRCAVTGEIIKCNGDHAVCPYGIFKRSEGTWQNQNSTR